MSERYISSKPAVAITDGLDPRLHPLPAVTEHGLSITERALPCGMVACTPFMGDCLQPEGDLSAPKARELCSSSLSALALSEALTETSNLLERVSIDVNTGILTYNTQMVMLERMFESGQIEKMRTRGYTLEILIADLNLLKQHNELGGHFGGNEALRVFASKLKPLYRRQGDNIIIRSEQFEQGILSHESNAREAIRQGLSFPQLGRFETGDEVIGLSWIEPPRANDQRVAWRPGQSLDVLERRVGHIVEELRDLSVSYPYIPAAAVEQIRESFGDTSLEFTVDLETGIVTAGVSATFGLAVAPLPEDMAHFKEMFDQVDEAAMRLKRQSNRKLTVGNVQSLFSFS